MLNKCTARLPAVEPFLLAILGALVIAWIVGLGLGWPVAEASAERLKDLVTSLLVKVRGIIFGI